MGYYATGGGCITLKQFCTKKQSDDAVDTLSYDFGYIDSSGCNLYLNFDGKYYEGILEGLNKAAEQAPFLCGEIEFIGEDGSHWRYTFNQETNSFIEEFGSVVWDGEAPLKWEEAPAFVGEIIDAFEDFLEDKGIDIQNPEKEQSESPAILYGMDYGILQSAIEEILINWSLLPEHR